MSETITQCFTNRIKSTPEKNALWYKENGKWSPIKWAGYGDMVDSYAKALLSFNISKGDKVALIGRNSPSWFFADMAIMTLGAVSVPVYWTSSGEQIKYILKHSDSRIFIIQNMEYFNRIEPFLGSIPGLETIVLVTPDENTLPGKVIDLAFFLSNGRKISDPSLSRARLGVIPDDTATFIYTSGTTGPPKAVMLSHKNCVTAGKNVFLTTKTDTKRSIACSYLPLSHVADRSMSLFAPLFSGIEIYFMRGYEFFAEDLKEIRPTLWVGVPRVWEKLFEGVMRHKDGLNDRKKKLINWALETGRRYNTLAYEKKNIVPLVRLKHFIARKIVIEKLLKSMGLDRVELTVTGGAPTSGEILDFFISIGIWLQDVYGQTEGHGTTSFARKDDIRFGSAGKPYPLVTLSIAEDDEILIKGDNVSSGYYKEPELTREAFKDGWLRTGDLGRIDEKGFLWITGRKKDIIITSGGKNITPAKIESLLMGDTLIEHAVVVGEGKKYLTALLTINEDMVQDLAAIEGMGHMTYPELVESDVVAQRLRKHIELINRELSRVEQIKKYRILPKPLSVENGELTNLSKIKRYVVIQNNSEAIEQMY